jgi:hypothetical protein
MAREDQADAVRSAIFARLERQVDPESRLPPDERARLVKAAARELSARLNAARPASVMLPSGCPVIVEGACSEPLATAGQDLEPFPHHQCEA